MRHCPAALVLAGLAAVGCAPRATGIPPSPSTPHTSQATLAVGSVVTEAAASVAPTSTVGVAPSSSSGCHVRGPLPDAACTPGSLNPAATQATIHQTICVSGYTATIRPPVSESNRLKRLAAVAYGVTDSLSNYEGDHLIALELGGAPDDIANFWDESRSGFPGSTEKDQLENYLNKAVCNGRMPLARAQQSIATNWTAAYCAARLSRCRDGVHFT